MEFTEEHLAKEADRLFSDPVLNKAVADIRAEALEVLTNVNPAHGYEIAKHQERVRLCEDFMLKLHEYVLRIRVPDDMPSPE